MDLLWFYKHQHDNRVRSKMFVECQQWLSIIVLMFVESQRVTYRAPVRYVTKTWSVVLLNKQTLILLSQVCYVWQVVKIPTIIVNNPVYFQREHVYTDLLIRENNIYGLWRRVVYTGFKMQSGNTPEASLSFCQNTGWPITHRVIHSQRRNSELRTFYTVWWCVTC